MKNLTIVNAIGLVAILVLLILVFVRHHPEPLLMDAPGCWAYLVSHGEIDWKDVPCDLCEADRLHYMQECSRFQALHHKPKSLQLPNAEDFLVDSKFADIPAPSGSMRRECPEGVDVTFDGQIFEGATQIYLAGPCEELEQ
jgi:hypothetical protein